MFRKMLKTVALAGCVFFSISGAAAQEVIHAYAGIVSAVDAVSRTITVAANESSQQVFKDLGDVKSSTMIDKRLRDGVIPVNTVKETGDYVIVFYFTKSRERIAVGLRNLGPGPFAEQIGTIVTFQDRSIVIRTKSGAAQSFSVNTDTITETSVGAIGGLKFQPEKGDLVRITATKPSGNGAVLFIDGTVVD